MSKRCITISIKSGATGGLARDVSAPEDGRTEDAVVQFSCCCTAGLGKLHPDCFSLSVLFEVLDQAESGLFATLLSCTT